MRRMMRSVMPVTTVVIVMLMVLGTQLMWDASCTYAVCQPTEVYTPGTSEVAAVLPEGTCIRAEETVGDAWREIEYLFGGQRRTGFVRSDALVLRSP